MDYERHTYKAAAKRISEEIGKLVADALILEVAGKSDEVTKLRDTASKLSQVLDGLKAQLRLPPPPTPIPGQQYDNIKAIESDLFELGKVEPAAISTISVVQANIAETLSLDKPHNLKTAAGLLAAYTWRSRDCALKARTIVNYLQNYKG